MLAGLIHQLPVNKPTLFLCVAIPIAMFVGHLAGKWGSE